MDDDFENEEPVDTGDEGMDMPEESPEESPEEKPEEQTEEIKEEDLEELFMSEVMGKIFSESKVDNILSKYFRINENEKKFIQEKKKKKQLFLENKKQSDKQQISRLSETVKQKKVASDVINSFPDMRFIGKTNKGNLVFEHNNKQLKVSPKGELL